MKNRVSVCVLCILLPLSIPSVALASQGKPVDSSQVRRLFARPTREYSSAPLWVWNDRLTEEQVVGTLRDLAGQQVRQAFVHPRPGLMTPYLSDEWFRLWKVALREARRLDMNLWIYDENSYPSGFAGGWVPELMPESRGRGLILREAKTSPKWEANMLAVFRIQGETAEDVTASVKAGESLPEGRYGVAEVRRAGNSPWTAGRCYVDLLYPGVTEKFLAVTLEAYRRQFGDQFGQRVPGSFTDEPELCPAGGLPWTDDLAQQFEKRWGYSLVDNLAGLNWEVGDWRKVRHNYFQTVLDLFIKRWARPYYEYCERHHLEFTGHYWEHDWPNCINVPDNMAMSAWQQRPGIDTLMNQYQEDTHAQFGNVRACREVSSLANQLGRQRTLVELYGAGGWDLRFVDMKRIGDWLQVLGINTLDEHLSYVTLRGARKRDHPQSFSYHEPWWEAYHVSAGYFARLTAALTQGEQVNRVLVLEPTTTAWMVQGNAAKLKEIGDSFFKLLMSLESAQVEYDLGCEDTMARHGSVKGKDLVIGRRAYPVVVLPSAVENLNGPTVALIERFLGEGGTVLRVMEGPQGETLEWPSRIDGAASTRAQSLAQSQNWRMVQANDAAQILAGMAMGDPFAVHRQGHDKGILFHHRRQISDGQILFLVNTSIEAPCAGSFESDMKAVERWDPYTGDVGSYPFENMQDGVNADFSLPPCGSLLLFLSKKAVTPPKVPALTATTVKAISKTTEVRRVHPNVLTLDYVDVTAGGETLTNAYFYQANQFAFRRNGMDRNPWDSAVQFKDELITKTFAKDSGFTATYRFSIEGGVPRNLAVVIERPDLYTITCNGKPVAAKAGRWWLDRAFGRIDIVSAARVGENTVTLKASPFTIYHELESAYVLGDFSLRAADKGFVIVPDQPLVLGPWNQQGQTFYATGVAYRQTFKVARPRGRYVVALGDWRGSVAKVKVNGQPAGHIVAPPWECDVTGKIRRGKNEVEVVVIGTLKNTLGPHHGRPSLGSAWPSMFQKGPQAGPPPGKDYDTLGYGLFEPFVLKEVCDAEHMAGPVLDPLSERGLGRRTALAATE